jgi:hypothetical protein
MAAGSVWVGLIEARPRGARSRRSSRTREAAYLSVVAPASHRFAFRSRAAEHVQGRGWRLHSVVAAAPLEKWLAQMSDTSLDEPGDVRDAAADAKEQATVRALALAVAGDGVARSDQWEIAKLDQRPPASFGERVAEWGWLVLWWVGVPLFAAFTLPYVLQDIGPAYRAEFGHGTPGVFTATARDCGKTCTSTGDWIADDGTRTRRDVVLATGAGAPRPGESVPAIDTGDRAGVYPAEGGWDWLLVTGFLVGICGTVLTWTYLLVRRFRER